MKSALQSLLVLLVHASVLLPWAHAQAPPPVPEGPRYIVTYVEVMPTASAGALKLMQQFRDASRNEAGNLRAETLQRIGQPHQFVILEVWKDQAAADAHSKGPAIALFRDKIKVLQIAPIDERVHFPLSVGPLSIKRTAGAIAVATHVDVIPPQREHGTAITKQLAEDGRKESGNVRFEAVVQTNRQNHFTLIEVWRDRKAADAHIMAAHTRAFRDKLGPASGALYDERFYRLVN